MKEADPDQPTLGDGLWKVQPRWVKTIVMLVGLPAWVVFVSTIFAGSFGGLVQLIAFVVFGAVTLITIVFVARAFWQTDL